jgi:hypothetical protein
MCCSAVFSCFNFKKEFMQCPICTSEIASNRVVCDKCGATLVTGRSTTGVLVGWLGMVMVILWGIMSVPLLILPFASFSLKGYPWPVFIGGALLSGGLLWYSKSTIRSKWVCREN